jgi:hypothetical protein
VSGPGEDDETGTPGRLAIPEVPSPPRPPRPLLERIGLAAIAAVLAMLFGGVAAAAWIGQEPFLAVMAAIGCLMTVWVGGMTLFRG